VSTKIWEAYCVKPGVDVWQLVRDIRVRAEKNVRKTLTKLYAELITDAKREPEKREGWLTKLALVRLCSDDAPPYALDYLAASRFVVDQFRATTGKSERSIWDLNVAVVFRRSGRRTLLIPYPGSGLLNSSLTFLRRHKALVDYHYQNASDRPRHISAQAWEGRARTWEPLLDDDRWQDKLELSIVSVEGWFRIDPAWNLLRRDMKRAMRDGKTAEQAVEEANL
jgi:hypothetical protein